MSAPSSGSTAMGRALGCHQDGLLDILLGLVLLDAWTIVRGGASSGGAFVILFPLLLVAKRAITAPRLPSPSTTAPESRPAPKAFGRVAVPAAFLAAPVIGALFALAGGMLADVAWELVALAGLGAVAAAGLRLGARRFVFYAGLALVAFLFPSHPEVAYLAPALAVGMAGWGGVLLVRFLATRPRVV
jgi:hypothetical protein